MSTKTRIKIVKVMEKKEKLRILNLNFLFCFINLLIFTAMNYSLDYFSSLKRIELNNMSTWALFSISKLSWIFFLISTKIMNKLVIFYTVCWYSDWDRNEPIYQFGTSLVAQTVKRLSTMWETWVQSRGWEDSLEKETASHSSTLA